MCLHTVWALHNDTFEIVISSTACHRTMLKHPTKICVKIVTNII